MDKTVCSFLAHLKDPHILGSFAAVALAYAAYCTWSREQSKQKMSLLFDCQSTVLPGPERIHVNAEFPRLWTIKDTPAKTVHEIFLRGVQKSGSKSFLGHRPDGNSDYVWATYDEIFTKARYLGSALCELGIPKKGLIGICAVNRSEWVIVDQGAMMFSMVLVPIYNTLGKEGLQFIIEETEMGIIFCDAAKAEVLLSSCENTKCLRALVLFDNLEYEKIAAKCNEMKELGMRNQKQMMLPTPDDLALICYTSGTTGNPKGVQLSHGNMALNVHVAITHTLAAANLSSEDRMISYLPLSHMYERLQEYATMYVGGKIGFYRGNIKELVDDIQMLKPTIFASVPRLFNNIYDKVMAGVSQSFIKRMIMKMALSSKTDELKRGIIRNDSFWDKIVFKKIQTALGGQVRCFSTGSAPLSSEVKTFLVCAFGCPVVEGYGQTENCGIATATSALDPKAGHVGPPAPCCRIKLIDAPELEYYARDDKGEICIQGSSVFSGYYKNEKKTRETLDEDQWCHTGDIGEWTPNGSLVIIDRKKHIFKLSQGEYIAPEKIETVYLNSPLVAQVLVTGFSLKPCAVALVVPDEEVLKKWASSHNFRGSTEELCKIKAVNDAILESMHKVGNAAGLNSLEQVKAVFLIAEQLTIESGLLTGTMKLKRRNVQDKYASEIQSLYQMLESTSQMSKSSFLK
eukprot:gene20230-22206_t